MEAIIGYSFVVACMVGVLLVYSLSLLFIANKISKRSSLSGTDWMKDLRLDPDVFSETFYDPRFNRR
jgi:hypothetical protein